MRSDVHFAALRAAAKVAFSVAFIGGCAAHAAEPDEGTNPDGTEPATTAEADLCAKNKTKKKTSVPAADCHHDAGVPRLSCDQVVAAAFPTEGTYPGKKQSVSAEVAACCLEVLADHDGGLPAHRWDCCANLPAGDHGQTVGIACTPWGPPVPPAMKRRVRETSLTSLQAVA